MTPQKRVKTLRTGRSRVSDGPGSQARALEPARDTVAADPRRLHWGDVRPSPMAHPAERPLPKLPRAPRPETSTT